MDRTSRWRFGPRPVDEVGALRAAVARLRGRSGARDLTELLQLGAALGERGEWRDAEQVFRELVPPATAEFGAQGKLTLIVWQYLALSWSGQGRPDEAVPLLAETEGVFEQVWGAEAETIACRSALVEVLGVANRVDERVAASASLVRYCAAELGDEDPLTIGVRFADVVALCDVDRQDEALRELDEKIVPFLRKPADLDRAEATRLTITAERGAEVLEPLRALADRHPRDGFYRQCLADTLVLTGDHPAAADLLAPLVADGWGGWRQTLRNRGTLAQVHPDPEVAAFHARAVLAAGAWPVGHPEVVAAQEVLNRWG
ncbi:tetratricopeptide repeat protein [Amycolatopsis sp. NPDC051903]|uniref:tetratricopeptide repeat protein n=1 Tax=Amycolatopsis sp. NPDC051903 TaxID=3363936 RepID=UPI0037939084